MAAPTFVNAGTADSGNSSVTPGMPSGVQTDDFLLLVIEGEGEDTSADDPPTGGEWTTIGSVASATDSAADRTRCSAYYHRYAGSDPNLTVPDAGNHTLARIYAFRGVDWTSGPFDATLHTFSSGTNATSHNSGGSSPATANTDSLVVLAHSHGDDLLTVGSYANTSLTDIGTGGDAETAAGSDGTINCAYGTKATAGAPAQWTWTTADSEEHAGFVFALLAYVPPPPPILNIVNMAPRVSPIAPRDRFA